MSLIPRSALVAVFLRSFLIQGAWNYHTMIGSGFGWAILPGLRAIHTRPDALQAAIDRHVDHFNAHPYLSTMALGAALRMEAEGEPPETIQRFKSAVRAPLGGLGDTLFWASWLPFLAMSAIVVGWTGLLPRWAVVVLFLVVYNLGHVGVRLWGFREGLLAGRGMARSLQRLNPTGLSERLRKGATFMLGGLTAVLLSGPGALVDAGGVWAALGGAAFIGGLVVGHRAWRPAAVAVVAAVTFISTWGIFT